MYHFHNFGQSLKFRGGADSWERVERGAQIGGKGLIAFMGKVRTNTSEVSTGCVLVVDIKRTSGSVKLTLRIRFQLNRAIKHILFEIL